MDIEKDERFSHILKDPKFRKIPKNERKVKIDNRFKSMFKDKKFKLKYTIDKRGRPVSHNSKEDLQRYYDLDEESPSNDDSSDDEDDDDDEENKEVQDTGRFVKAPKSEEEDDESNDKSDKNDNELSSTLKSDKEVSDIVRKKLKDLNVDYARGEGTLMSESSSDDNEEDSEISDSETIEHKWGELDADADRTDEITRRLAICNMDWDRIRATDLMVLFSSFLPPGGLIHSIAIYPSEYGLQRMKEEEVKGPIELVEHQDEADEFDKDQEEGSKFHMEKLRQYQLNRLKYYYGVLTCDSGNTANKIYTECDGMEYESTATKIDLRFVPDDMIFDAEPKEICDQLPDLAKYKPRFFTTTALQQAKVDLTWDETNPDRVELTSKLTKGKIDEVSDADLQNYLAVSSSDESEEEEVQKESDDEGNDKNSIDKYKALLQEIEENESKKKNRDVELEISWGIDLKEKTDKLIKEKNAESENKTPFQKYLDKVKEKKKERRLENKKKKQEEIEEDSDIPSDIDMNDPYFAEEFNNPEFKKNKKKHKHEKDELNEEDKQKQAELELLLLNEKEDKRKHFSLKKLQESENQSKKKKNRKNKTEKNEEQFTDDFEINVNDDRFSAVFTSHHYNIDPTDPHYKKTKAMEKLIAEKIKRRNEEDGGQEEKSKKVKVDNKKNTELNVLVKSVKRKAEAFKKRN